MKQGSYIFAALAAMALTHSAHAEGLSGEEIMNQIVNKTVLLDTGYGIALPLYYSKSGNVTGDASGTMLGSMFAPKETGKWWVKQNRICQQFPKWHNGDVLCFSLKRTGSKTFNWTRQDGKTGTARLG